ncbi:hypothetical protein CPB83DRAFT_770368 [Crepidotus variabilis]|uniref:Uncharacterized protein n=1 Tax=Crepidotus variabilis TaxID=179855 RepID=A0A9P6JMJ5_9AGAR|nr:hypothetical protein CPB83DRAFT_770368 [Crepidotus variabilis]
MPLTFKVASHSANPVQTHAQIQKADDVLLRTWGENSSDTKLKELFQSSFSASRGPKTSLDIGSVLPNDNGLIGTVVKAYCQHHHLVLRPDDIWMAILCQFNFYVNANAEKLRSSFVAHEGKKPLIVKAVGTRYTVDFGNMAKTMTEEIDKNVIDKSLKDWILPNFSTTTKNDTVICAVLMMSTMKAYFEYSMYLTCGLPSVTLLGTKSDWESLVSRLDKLYAFGAEPAAFATLLKPILSRFVQAFRNAEVDTPQDLDFWSRICHHHKNSSGPSYISGWITAFGAWNEEGVWKGPEILATSSVNGRDEVTLKSQGRPTNLLETRRPSRKGSVQPLDTPTEDLILDGVPYSYIDLGKIPLGYCEVEVLLNDNGVELKCMMVSGLMGSVIEGDKQDTLKPLPVWFMFEKEEAEQKEI